MEFSVTGMFRDCLTRQKSEALRINFSNSKGECGGNIVSRLTVQEDAWERRERDRQEEELEELNKKKVEEFRKMKSLQCVQHTPDPPSGMHTAGGSRLDTTQAVTAFHSDQLDRETA